MAEFRWIILSLFLMLEFSFSAITGKFSLLGNEVTLSCEHVIQDQDQCDGTTWLFGKSGTTAVTLVEHGKIHKEAEAKSDRLSVTENCSLVVKKVTAEDAGDYTCRQFKSGQQQGPDSQVLLSVVTMTEQKYSNQVTLNCSVSPYDHCRHTVKWLYEGHENDSPVTKRSQGFCSATVTFTTSHFDQMSKQHKLLECKVRDNYTDTEQLFPFSSQSSGEKTGDDATTTTATVTPTTIKSTSTTTSEWTSVEMSTSGGTNQRTTNNDHGGDDATTTTATVTPTTIKSTSTTTSWWLIAVPVGVAALLIIAVAVIRWRRTKGNQTQSDGDTADPEGVAYASISYTRETNSRARARGDDDDEGDTVTYSAVRAPSSSAGASADPGDLYATVNKPKK